jgi:nitrite reductase (NADH) large subunit
VLDDPDKLSRFVSFVNAPDAVDSTVTFTEHAGRKIPVSIGMPTIREDNSGGTRKVS